jgi:hypothetical protein
MDERGLPIDLCLLKQIAITGWCMAGSDLTDISGRVANTPGKAVHLSDQSSIVRVILIEQLT